MAQQPTTQDMLDHFAARDLDAIKRYSFKNMKLACQLWGFNSSNSRAKTLERIAANFPVREETSSPVPVPEQPDESKAVPEPVQEPTPELSTEEPSVATPSTPETAVLSDPAQEIPTIPAPETEPEPTLDTEPASVTADAETIPSGTYGVWCGGVVQFEALQTDDHSRVYGVFRDVVGAHFQLNSTQMKRVAWE